MDSLARMTQILALLEANPQGISGEKLAQACNISWAQLQKDLETMTLATENPIPLYTDTDELSSDSDPELTPQSKWFLETSCKRNCPVFLTVGETLQILDGLDLIQHYQKKTNSLRQKISAGLDLNQQESFRYIKGTMTPVERMDEEILRIISLAIRCRKKIRFNFNSRVTIAAPLGVVYYSRLRQWYFVAQIDQMIKTYNFSKIENMLQTTDSFTYPESFSLQEWLAPRWGMEFGESMHVKVRFLNRSQTFAKVRKDVAHRRCHLTEGDGGKILIFEDDVIGKNEFIAWILGFGSAAEVLEPVKLRQEILARIKTALARYS
ncbi:MAG: WYL domain-containing protein [Peptococcaceae bacterium]|nr:WYL domain-containing protein [Peptococcaceae bacterium]